MISILTVFIGSVAAASDAGVSWHVVGAGVEYGTVQVVASPSLGDGLFHLVRIDPKVAVVKAEAATLDGGVARTAADWSRNFKYSVVFNAGMYETDYLTHTGRFTIGAHRNNPKWVESYKSAVIARGEKSVEMIDTETFNRDAGVPTYFVQNLRLIRRPGVNVWAQTQRAWSEVALTALASGQLMVVFTRTPFTMHDFNENLLALGLGVVAAQHLEGGPEASLSIHGGGINVDFAGSYETNFMSDDSNKRQWVLPNVFGVRSP